MSHFSGKILKINLTKQKVDFITLPDHIYSRYIGGRGLAGYFLQKKIDLPIDHVDMPILIFAGALSSECRIGASKLTIMSKSPLNGGIGDNSCQGKFASILKTLNIDGIILEGKSDFLTGIEIQDEKIIFKEANHLKDLPLSDIMKSFKKIKGSVLTTAIAADNQVRFSNIFIDGRFTSPYAGLGFNFASKNIKYLVITNSKNIHNAVDDAKNKDIERLINASPYLKGEFGISHYTDSCLMDLAFEKKLLSTSYFSETRKKDIISINAPAIKKAYQVKNIKTCNQCLVNCKKIISSKLLFPGFEELASISAYSDQMNLSDIMNVYKACYEAGVSINEAMNVIMFYNNIHGKKPEFDKLMELLDLIVTGKEEGKYLKEGVYLYALKTGKTKDSLTVNQMSLSPIDPRGAYGTALSYITSTLGGNYFRAYLFMYELLRKPVALNRFTFNGKARTLKISEDIFAVADSLGICSHVMFAVSLEEFVKTYNKYSKKKLTALDLMSKGEYIYNQEIKMNQSNGLMRNQMLPDYFFSKSTAVLQKLNKNNFKNAIKEYWSIRNI